MILEHITIAATLLDLKDPSTLRREVRTKRAAATDAVTLFEAGFAVAAKHTVKQFSLTYVELVMASEALGNSTYVAKAEALTLLSLGSAEVIRLLSVRDSQLKAHAS